VVHFSLDKSRLNSLSANRWPNETGAKVEISGEDYKKIWKILNEEQ
jgi:hypothetical protein